MPTINHWNASMSRNCSTICVLPGVSTERSSAAMDAGVGPPWNSYLVSGLHPSAWQRSS